MLTVIDMWYQRSAGAKDKYCYDSVSFFILYV